MNECIILAGGLGTRLKSVVKDVPKPMALINNKPFLEYIFQFLYKNNIEKVILSTGYKSNIIKDYFKNNYKNMEIIYSEEKTPLGTGGAVKKALNYSKTENVFILNGDTLFNIDLGLLYRFHLKNQSDLSMALKKMYNCSRYASVKISKDYKIISFSEKKKEEECLINGGIYILNKGFFLSLNLPDKFSFEHDFLEKFYKDYKFYGLPFDSYFIDIGIPEDYKKAKKELINNFF